MFWLKLFDTPLCSFEMTDDPLEGQKAHFTWIDEDNQALLPIGLKPTDESLLNWLCSRVIPRNRAFVNAFLVKSGLNPGDTRGILQICRVLSLNDCYWVVEDGFEGKFADYNL